MTIHYARSETKEEQSWTIYTDRYRWFKIPDWLVIDLQYCPVYMIISESRSTSSLSGYVCVYMFICVTDSVSFFWFTREPTTRNAKL